MAMRDSRQKDLHPTVSEASSSTWKCAVKRGDGYVSATAIRDDLGMGSSHRSVHTPVRKCNYTVEPAVWADHDYDKLTVEVWPTFHHSRRCARAFREADQRS